MQGRPGDTRAPADGRSHALPPTANPGWVSPFVCSLEAQACPWQRNHTGEKSSTRRRTSSLGLHIQALEGWREISGEQCGHVTSAFGGQERGSGRTAESEEPRLGTASASEGDSRRLHCVGTNSVRLADGSDQSLKRLDPPPPVRQTDPISPHPTPGLQREMNLWCGVEEVTEAHGATCVP